MAAEDEMKREQLRLYRRGAYPEFSPEMFTRLVSNDTSRMDAFLAAMASSPDMRELRLSGFCPNPTELAKLIARLTELGARGPELLR